MKPFRVFVTGTDTGVGKTEVSCALLSVLHQEGRAPAALKPYESGGTSDSERLWAASGKHDPYAHCAVHQLKAPLAPAVAARLEKKKTPFSAVKRAYRRFDGRSLVVEGAGGLFVPVDGRRDIIDVIAELALPVLLVARAGLGTLNHVALSLGALEARDVEVLGIALVQATAKPDASVAHNAQWLADRHGLPIIGPLSFERSKARREVAFQRALAQWLDAR